jgi:hypothetical protein
MTIYEKCAHCWHFTEPNDTKPDEFFVYAAYVHLDDGGKEHDHDAEPSGDVRTLDQWRHDHPELFTEYGDGAIGPNSGQFTPVTGQESTP